MHLYQTAEDLFKKNNILCAQTLSSYPDVFQAENSVWTLIYIAVKHIVPEYTIKENHYLKYLI